MSGGAVFVTMRVEDLPVPHVPSIRRACERCRKPVWIDAGSLANATAREGSEPLVLCDVCASEVAL